MEEWYRAATTIEWMQCQVEEVLPRLQQLDRMLEWQVENMDDASIRAEAAAQREVLRPILLGFAGDVRDPGHVNLAGRLRWFTIQVGNYSGPPTAAQWEWIERYERQLMEYAPMLEELRRMLGDGGV